MHASLFLLVLGATGSIVSSAQGTPPNTFPHAWPGQPKGKIGEASARAWQDYFAVTQPLPNLTAIHPSLPRSFAGNIPVDRPGHPNDTLFFWAFERASANGTLTAPARANNTEPWIIWLNGGPGSSSIKGLSVENGPIQFQSNGSWVANPFSWNTLADTVWIDQPVGTGFSTADTIGYVADEDQMAEDFLRFLANLVKVFPSLATRPLYLTGESYAGTYIPYITKHLFSTPSPPVKLAKIAIGDGSLGAAATIRDLPVINVIETYPAIIGFDQDVFNYFREQHHPCGYDLNLTYPQNGTFPTLRPPTRPSSSSYSTSASWLQTISSKYNDVQSGSYTKRAEFHNRREERRIQWKRDLTGRANGTIDPWYGCDVFNELTDYAVNFTYPWTNGDFDVYDIPDATNPEPPSNPSTFLNDPRTRAALHAPTSKNWTGSFTYPFGSVYNRSIGNLHGDPSVEPVAFLTDLATNASARGIPFVFYSGNDDSLVQHRGTEVIIQNFTFGGVQGFTRKPATPWFDDDGAFAGVVHQERNLTYVLVAGAGHLVPQWRPKQALVLLREFVLGSNRNGSVDGTSVVGGEDTALAGDYLPGGTEVYYGSGATQGTSTVPAASMEAWNSFVATATASPATVPATTTTDSSAPTQTTNGGVPGRAPCTVLRMAAYINIVVAVLFGL